MDQRSSDVVMPSSKSEFASVMRHYAQRAHLTGGQIHTRSGVPKETVYRYLREDTTTFPRNLAHVRSFLQACDVEQPQLTKIIERWHQLNGTTSTNGSADMVIEAEVVSETFLTVPKVNSEAAPAEINILGNVRGDVHVYMSRNTGRAPDGGNTRTVLLDFIHTYLALVPGVIAVLFPYLMLTAWKQQPLALVPKTLLIIALPSILAIWFVKTHVIARARRSGTLGDKTLPWETCAALALAGGGGLAVGTAVERWWISDPATTLRWPGTPEEALNWIHREGSYRGAVAGVLFGVMVFALAQTALQSMNWTNLRMIAKTLPLALVTALLLGGAASFGLVQLLHSADATAYSSYVGLTAGILLSLLSTVLISENKWIRTIAERRPSPAPPNWYTVIQTALARYIARRRRIDLAPIPVPSVADITAQTFLNGDTEPLSSPSDNDTKDSVEAFCSDLKQLKTEAGFSFRDMEHRTFYSKSTLADAVNPARGLPRFPVVAAFVGVFNNDSREIRLWAERYRALDARAKKTGLPDVAPTHDSSDMDDFFHEL
ncbi:hypothetical protein ACWDXV_33975 [Nocardia nova]